MLLVDATLGSRSLSHLIASGVQQGLITPQDRGGALASRIVTDKRTDLDIFLPDSSIAANPDSVWQTLTDDFIREVSESYDLVIVDLPALTSGPEVREAARKLDAFLLVVKWDSTDSN